MALDDRRTGRIGLRAPVIIMVLAATAVPVELRPPSGASLDFHIYAGDLAANLAGYVPLGIVLGGLGIRWAVIVAASMAAFAEIGQFGMLHRDPSAIDFASNVLGAALGAVASARLGIRSPGVRIDRSRAWIASALAPALALWVWSDSGGAFNPRGAMSPGTLEAHWKLDEGRGGAAFDSSSHGLDGRLIGEPRRVGGVLGGAVTLDGATEWIEIGRSTPLRLSGSMTICAWIKPSAFPGDDAAIVSQLSDGLGYQLDTTVDRGPRTIGFKLTDLHGGLMARYGATPLVLDTWSHVAGVYDARERTLDVYLNGELDDGSSLGSVSGVQRSSRAGVEIGRRTDLEGFGFAGSIDDVRIYSLALDKAQVAAAMKGAVIDPPGGRPAAGKSVADGCGAGRGGTPGGPPARWSDREEATIPGAAAALGVLAAAAFAGFRPSSGPLALLAAALAAGLLLLLALAPTLPPFNLWVTPLASLAGGASVAVSFERACAVRRRPAPGEQSGMPN